MGTTKIELQDSMLKLEVFKALVESMSAWTDEYLASAIEELECPKLYRMKSGRIAAERSSLVAWALDPETGAVDRSLDPERRVHAALRLAARAGFISAPIHKRINDQVVRVHELNLLDEYAIRKLNRKIDADIRELEEQIGTYDWSDN
jgi:hypothetical protein